MSIDLSKSDELESVAAVITAHRVLEPALAAPGLPPITVLMAELDAAVVQVHGEAPDTPTWDDVVAAWAEHHGATAAATAESSEQA